VQRLSYTREPSSIYGDEQNGLQKCGPFFFLAALPSIKGRYFAASATGSIHELRPRPYKRDAEEIGGKTMARFNLLMSPGTSRI
jgi:hypothetical protein